MYSIRPYGGPRANKMAEVALNLTKEAVSPDTGAFRQFCKLQIFKTFRKTDCHIQFAVKMSNAAGRLGTYTHTHTNYYNPRAHAPSVNEVE